VWGLGGVLGYEHPELRCTRVDLSPAGFADELQALLEELVAGDREEQIALRPEGRYVARLARRPLPATAAPVLRAAEGRAFRLEIDEPGVIDRLAVRAHVRRPPSRGEVEIEITSTGLNFLDVMKALGIYPGLPEGPVPFGGECSGRIVALGEDVEGLQLGQEVMAFAPFSFGSHVTVAALAVLPRPSSLTPDEAASLPTVFMTAWYALHGLARLQKGERILIHAAAGGTGMAALQLAKRAGAEIFATAGTPEKRALVRELGAAHVMDSRTLSFAEEIMALTKGEGVDVVLNSLAGEAMEKSLSVLAPDGRFLELGKRDIYSDKALGLAPFRKSISYSAIDLAGLATRRPARFRALFEEVVGAFSRGEIQPLPLRVFPMSRVHEAFREMAQARHTGKLVVSMRDPELRIQVPAEEASRLRPDATYLITGGLGGLGLSVARWMVERGARHLVLLGRKGATTPAQTAAVEALRAAGSEVKVAAADVAEPAQLARVLAEVDAHMPPLRGVIHAAGVLDDGAVLTQELGRFRNVMAPKAAGAWNLHLQTRARTLDFFVLYSSAASLLGSPGQGNYAAANAFLDALAHHRRALGLPALSINWGAFSEVGLAAARAEQGGRFEQRGIGTLTPARGEELLGQLLRGDMAQVGVVPLDVRQWVEFYPQASRSPFLGNIVKEATQAPRSQGKGGAFGAVLREAAPEARGALLEGFLREQISLVLRLEPSKLDRDAPLRGLGVDSLMALELRNRLESGLGLTLPATLLWAYPTLAALAAHLGERMDISPHVPAPAVSEAASDTPADAALQSLSDQELIDELARELALASEEEESSDST
jgi:NADPH:quinone reductase-like Zn-dependent oxidoreductase/acyl carrier protein